MMCDVCYSPVIVSAAKQVGRSLNGPLFLQGIGSRTPTAIKVSVAAVLKVEAVTQHKVQIT